LTIKFFEKPLSNSFGDFIHVTGLKDEEKCCLQSVAERKDIFGILPTVFGKV